MIVARPEMTPPAFIHGGGTSYRRMVRRVNSMSQRRSGGVHHHWVSDRISFQRHLQQLMDSDQAEKWKLLRWPRVWKRAKGLIWSPWRRKSLCGGEFHRIHAQAYHHSWSVLLSCYRSRQRGRHVRLLQAELSVCLDIGCM